MKVIKLKDDKSSRLNLDSILTYTEDIIKSNGKIAGYRLCVRFKTIESLYLFDYYKNDPEENFENFKKDVLTIDGYFNIK